MNVSYDEGIFVGYRWLEKEKIKPEFAFGHGLSYSTFDITNAKANKTSLTENEDITFTVDVKNTGKVAASEIVQLYISDIKSSVPRPIKELKGFRKVYLQPGESQTVEITINKEALSYFDAKKHDWVAEKGDFEALIGNSSDNIKSKVKFTLK